MIMTSDPFRLDGRRVLVTGATSDIGRAIAVTCSRAGASIVATGRNRERLEQTLAALEPEGDHRAIVADLRNDTDRVAIAESADNYFGVVHGAAVTGAARLRSIWPEFLEERLTVNLVAPLFLTRHLLRAAKIQDGGAIVFVSSLSALAGTRGASVYAASKAGQIAAARCMALEVAEQRIRVNCIAPGIVRTRVYDAMGEDWIAQQSGAYPLGLGKPEDVALATLFLVSEASRWITGQTLILSGALSVV